MKLHAVGNAMVKVTNFGEIEFGRGTSPSSGSSRPVGTRLGTVVARGYTLIELILVMGILALAAALLVPHLVDRDSLAVQSVVRLIIADLSFAQSDALANQEYRRIQFYADGRGYCLYRVTDADFAAPFDPNLVDYDYLLDPLHAQRDYIVDFTEGSRFEGISISAVNIDGGTRQITYDALGGTVVAVGTPGIGGQITVSSPSGDYRIDIAPFTGKLTVIKL
ncbi:MAG: prepilin-type N-terminal cleavage/methylation domain-containing protein [Planctomycetes bacterium]|nr:prepilin-type N-terminal cleavage/methylation domain-containing protein [Planctomycetota bacterium]